MRTSLIALTIAFAALGSAQRRPACARSCYGKAFQKGVDAGCAEDDVKCFCTDGIAVLYRDCAWEECEDDDTALSTIDFGVQLCEEAGVEFDLPIKPEPEVETPPPVATRTRRPSRPEPTNPSTDAPPAPTRSPRPRLPQCARSCYEEIFEIGQEAGCDEEDIKCYCTVDNAVTYRDCTWSSCETEEEALGGIQYAQRLCLGAGVEFDIPIKPEEKPKEEKPKEEKPKEEKSKEEKPKEKPKEKKPKKDEEKPEEKPKWSEEEEEEEEP